MNSVSFGKKIPITQCQIKDNKRNKFVPATFYEVDCTDMNEIKEVYQAKGDWQFKNQIAATMEDKNYAMRDSFFFHQSKAFYIMQKSDGEIVGMSEVTKMGPKLVLDFIESEPKGKYKYVGQTMIASLCKVMKQENRQKIYIPVPVKSAKDFYKKVCGFKDTEMGSALLLKGNRVKKLQKNVETKTHSPILEVNA